jgi:hypothetical protein
VVGEGTDQSAQGRVRSHSELHHSASEIPPGLAESLVGQRKQTRVLADFGWTEDGRIFLSYMLSEGAISNGMVTVPSRMKQHLQGSYELRVTEGPPIGKLTVKASQAWGLGPLFLRRGGEVGDLLVIFFDLKNKSATVELGQTSVEPKDERL